LFKRGFGADIGDRLIAYVHDFDRGGSTLKGEHPMAERFHYRGYDIMPKRQWSSWCAGIYPTRADLPFLPRSTLDILRSHRQDVVDEATRAIDHALEDLPKFA
jgi:hypothetical protein